MHRDSTAALNVIAHLELTRWRGKKKKKGQVGKGKMEVRHAESGHTVLGGGTSEYCYR